MRASGFTCTMRYVAHATLGAVLRNIGSLSILSLLIPGNCSSTRCSYSWFVLIYMFSSGTIPVIRSYVCCNRVLPVEKKSRNCLGHFSLLHGHNLRPFPPASIRQKSFSLYFIIYQFMINGALIYILLPTLPTVFKFFHTKVCRLRNYQYLCTVL